MTRVALLACLLAAAVLAVSAHGQSTSEPVVFDVGNTQDIDSMNPLVGVSVPSYEAWNIQYEQLVGRYKTMPFASSPTLDLNRYVTDKTLAGLFTVVGEEEKKIRTNPAARATDLLKQVFGR